MARCYGPRNGSPRAGTAPEIGFETEPGGSRSDYENVQPSEHTPVPRPRTERPQRVLFRSAILYTFIYCIVEHLHSTFALIPLY